jgi:transcriptional regulator with XRE-family HTH domain
MSFRHHLGQTLQKYRLSQGYTLRQVSAEIPIAIGYLSEVERGKKEVSSEILDQLLKFYKIPLYRAIYDTAALIKYYEISPST